MKSFLIKISKSFHNKKWHLRSYIICFFNVSLNSIFKNVSSSTSRKKNPCLRLFVCLYSNLRKFFLTHSFMNRFWQNFIWMITLWMQIFNLIKYDLNGYWRSQKVTFMFILTLTFVLMDKKERKIFLLKSVHTWMTMCKKEFS